jgi:hypothetical protein
MRLKELILIVILSSWVLINKVYSQKADQLAIKVSYNFLKLEYNHDFFSRNMHTGLAAGIGKNGSLSKKIDLYGEIHSKLPLLKQKRSEILVNTYGGICHNKEAGLFSVFGMEIEYEYKFGQKKKHALIFNSGFRYGKKIFIKEYENKHIKVFTQENYSLPVISVLIGYGYRFLD